jgi:hypothetical protein
MNKFVSFLLIFVLFLIYDSCTYSDIANSASIALPEIMVNVSGAKVNSIRLLPGTAAILRYAGSTDVRFSTSRNLPTSVRERKNVRLGGYFYGGWENDSLMSPVQLSWIAQNLDVLVLNNYYPDVNKNNGGISPDNVDSLKQRNPRLKYYSMLFATTLREPLFNPQTMSNWVLFNKMGKESTGVRRGYDTDLNHLMDLGNRDYAAFLREFIINYTGKYHADGVAIDEIMWNGYWGVDLKNLRDYSTVDQIRQTCYDWLQRIKSNNNSEVIHQAFWADAQTHTNGVWGETSFYSWFRDGHDYDIFYRTMTFGEILGAIKAYSQKGETYVWAAWYDQDDPDQLEYCVATYLLGKEGDYTVFQPQPIYGGGYPNNLSGYDVGMCISEVEKNRAILDIELGPPIGDLYTEVVNKRQIWIRKFAGGIVYCNPNDY